MELNATSVALAANILSLINLVGDSSIASTSQSASFPQDFSALLTEMMGATAGQSPIEPEAPPVQVPNVTQMPVPSAAQPVQLAAPTISVASPTTEESKSDDRNTTKATAADEPVSASSGPPQQSAESAMANTKPPTTLPAEQAEAANRTLAGPGPKPTLSGQPTPAELANPAVVVASDPKEVNVAGLEKSTVAAVNDLTFLADSMKDAQSKPGPASTEPVPNRPEPKIASAQEPAQIAVLSPVLNVVETGETSKTVVAGNPATRDKAAQANNIVPLVPFLHFAVSPFTFAPAVADSKSAKLDQPVSEPVPVFQVTHSELARAFADVKKFELSVQPGIPTASTAPAGQPASVPQDQPSTIAFVTTDPVKNVMQQQLPPGIVPILKVVPGGKAVDRSKSSAAPGNDLIATAPTSHLTDLVRPVEHVDQAPAAHTIEIPNIPHLPVVRIVSMQVGEADSAVTVRIQERDGNLTLQLNADDDRLHQNLQSSVGSLAQALKLENIPVSGIEVSRKSLTDKVRRMKETH